MRATLYSGQERDREVEVDSKLVESLTASKLLWIDLDQVQDGELEELGRRLKLPDGAMQGITRRGTLSEMERFSDCIRLRVVAIQPPDNGNPKPDGVAEGSRTSTVDTAAIDVVAARNIVVTAHDGSVAAFESFTNALHGDTHLGKLDAVSFMTSLIDEVLATYLAAVEDVERTVDSLDELALRSRDAEFFLGEIVALRRRVASLRRALAPLRVTLAPLGRPDLEIPGLGEPWPGLLDRLERTVDAVENARELIIGSFDVFMARNAERTNDIMKTLTILNAILLPAVVVAGVMGMNFRVAFFEDPVNFWFVIAAMVTLATGILAFSRWRKWV
jgi:Mg2+ and Co2+ transporter CorA